MAGISNAFALLEGDESQDIQTLAAKVQPAVVEKAAEPSKPVKPAAAKPAGR
jgi:hypothetical protein